MQIGMKTRHEKEQDVLGMRRPRWDRRVIRSLGDDFFVDIVHMKIMMSRLQENTRDGTDIKAHQVTS